MGIPRSTTSCICAGSLGASEEGRPPVSGHLGLWAPGSLQLLWPEPQAGDPRDHQGPQHSLWQSCLSSLCFLPTGVHPGGPSSPTSPALLSLPCDCPLWTWPLPSVCPSSSDLKTTPSLPESSCLPLPPHSVWKPGGRLSSLPPICSPELRGQRKDKGGGHLLPLSSGLSRPPGGSRLDGGLFSGGPGCHLILPVSAEAFARG